MKALAPLNEKLIKFEYKHILYLSYNIYKFSIFKSMMETIFTIKSLSDELLFAIINVNVTSKSLSKLTLFNILLFERK